MRRKKIHSPPATALTRLTLSTASKLPAPPDFVLEAQPPAHPRRRVGVGREAPDLPRRDLVTRDDVSSVSAVVFGTLVSVGALGAALPVIASGGALAAIVAAALTGGAAATAIGEGLRGRIV